MDPIEEGGYNLLLAFDSDALDFVRGFEAGRIWTLMRTDWMQLVGQPFHAANAEMVMRMIEACDVPLRAEFMSDDAWMVLALS